MQLHQAFDVSKAQERLLGESVVASFFEVGGTKFDIRTVLGLVEILADFHDLVKVILLAVDLNSLLVHASLDIEISCFFPVA